MPTCRSHVPLARPLYALNHSCPKIGNAAHAFLLLKLQLAFFNSWRLFQALPRQGTALLTLKEGYLARRKPKGRAQRLLNPALTSWTSTSMLRSVFLRGHHQARANEEGRQGTTGRHSSAEVASNVIDSCAEESHKRNVERNGDGEPFFLGSKLVPVQPQTCSRTVVPLDVPYGWRRPR